MTVIVIGVLLALAAMSLGLRATALVIPRVRPLWRLLASAVAGTILVLATLQLCDRYGVYDLGLGLQLSLAPVGIFDLLKWWHRRKA